MVTAQQISTSGVRRGKYLLAGLYVAGVTLSHFFTFSNWAYDDPFITYRYAANLARGAGFVYNPGQPVLSTTTPLFTLVLALPGSLWGDIPRLANLIGYLSLAVGALFLWDLARSWRSPAVGWVGLLLYPAFPLLITTLGSETPFYMALCLGAFAFYARERYLWAGVFAALAVLARPDGALVAVVLSVDYLLRARQEHSRKGSRLAVARFPASIPWVAVILFIGVSLPWYLFAWLYFGSPFPATLAAKQQQGSMAISQSFAPGFLTIVSYYAARWHYWIAAALAVLGLVFLASQARRWALLLSWTALYFLAYTILGVSRYYWYYAPLVPGFLALVGLGFAALSSAERGNLWQPLTSRSSRRPFAIGRPAMALSFFLLGLLFVFQVRDLGRIQQNPDPRYPLYRAVGEWLNQNTPAEAQVGSLEVGIIGYYAGRSMVDFAGLLQPQVAAQLSPARDYQDAAQWAVEHYQPDYLVIQDGGFPRLEQGYIGRHCTRVQHFLAEVDGAGRDLSVYACIK